MRDGGWANNLTEEQKTAIDNARDQFRKETEPLRVQIQEKRAALRDALNAETPDKAQVVELQKELSALEGEFDQMAVQHRLEMRKLLPDDSAGRGFGRRGDRGFGPGYCWR